MTSRSRSTKMPSGGEEMSSQIEKRVRRRCLDLARLLELLLDLVMDAI